MMVKATYEELADCWWKIKDSLDITDDSPNFLKETLTVAFESVLKQCGWTISEWNYIVELRTISMRDEQ